MTRIINCLSDKIVCFFALMASLFLHPLFVILKIDKQIPLPNIFQTDQKPPLIRRSPHGTFFIRSSRGSPLPPPPMDSALIDADDDSPTEEEEFFT